MKGKLKFKLMKPFRWEDSHYPLQLINILCTTIIVTKYERNGEQVFHLI